MTLHRLPASHGLLARKGGAAPLGLRKPTPEPAAPELDDAQAKDPKGPQGGQDAAGGPEESFSESLAETRAPVQLALVAGAEGTAAAGGQGEPAPPASMLPFALHRTRREQGDAWELVSPDLLVELAEAAAHPETPAPNTETQGAEARETQGAGEREAPSTEAPGADEPEPSPAAAAPETEAARPEHTPAGPETVATPAPASTAAEPALAVPKADPAWRVGLDTMPGTRRSGQQPWLWALAAACLAIVAIAWWSFESQAPAPDAPAADADTGVAAGGVAAGGVAAPGAEPADPASTPSPLSQEPAEAAPTTPAAVEESQAPQQSLAEIAPKVDLVRIETNGDAVIAGRAAPESELIILDNGAPIGTVKADAFGEWVFVPEVPLPAGEHAFSLVLKAEQGRVTVPAKPEPSPAAPAAEGDAETDAETGDGADAGTTTGTTTGDSPLSVPLPSRKPLDSASEGAPRAPIPARKPSTGADRTQAPAAPGADFVVQLASVKTRAGAQREWEKLQLRFPEVLAGMDLSLHEAKLAQQGTVIRVRTGPFSELGEAADFCARIRAGRQDCLVVRASDQ